MRIYRKYSGAGNTFLAFENFRGDFPLEKVPYLCRLHSVDGVILASSSEVGDFQMSYYNADGSFGAMCGNGLRCFAHFLRDLGLCLSLYQIEVGGNVLTVKCEESTISTFLPWPKLPQERVMVYTDELYKINTGVPHVVRFACEGVDVEEEGKRLRYHSLFEPDGVNANFVRIVDEKTLYVRTYERGVERETLACGTGVAASAIVAYKLGKCQSQVDVITQSKQKIQVRLGKEIELIGPSEKLSEGVLLG